jgi:hypothetical protein
MSLLKSQDDPQLKCLPVATPRSEPYPFRIVETPTHHLHRHGSRSRVPTGVHGWSEASDRETTCSSRGRATRLDTGKQHARRRHVGFNDLTWFDNWGHVHSDKMHVVERFTRVDLGHLNASVLVDDPAPTRDRSR